jgi:hypothetical protein
MLHNCRLALEGSLSFLSYLGTFFSYFPVSPVALSGLPPQGQLLRAVCGESVTIHLVEKLFLASPIQCIMLGPSAMNLDGIGKTGDRVSNPLTLTRWQEGVY